MRLPLATLLAALATPLAAQDTAPQPPRDAGAVTQLLAAQALFDLGLARKDPLAALSAARLMSGLTATDADRQPDPPGDAVPPTYPTADFMFTAARALAQEDDLATDLIARTEAEAPRTPTLTLIRSSRGIGPGESHAYSLPFFADALAEVGLLGDGKANLDLSVAIGEGEGESETLCLDTGPSDRALCAFSPAENATFTITVTNRSETAATYSLLTN